MTTVPMESDRLPTTWSLAIVVFLVFVAGMLSLIEMLVAWLVHASPYVNVGILAIPLAWGLNRHNAVARWCAIGVLCFVLGYSPIALVLWCLTDNLEDSFLGGLRGFSLILVLSGVSAWMLWVLCRPDTRDLFHRESPQLSRGIRLRFRLAHLFAILLIAALFFFRVLQDDVVYVYRQDGLTFAGTLELDGQRGVEKINVQYGYRECRFMTCEPIVDYVVFARQTVVGAPFRGLASIELVGEYGAGQLPSLKLPDGTTHDFPTGAQLTEFELGKFRTAEVRVNLEELRVFIESGERLTLDSLVEFLEGRQRSGS